MIEAWDLINQPQILKYFPESAQYFIHTYITRGWLGGSCARMCWFAMATLLLTYWPFIERLKNLTYVHLAVLSSLKSLWIYFVRRMVRKSYTLKPWRPYWLKLSLIPKQQRIKNTAQRNLRGVLLVLDNLDIRVYTYFSNHVIMSLVIPAASSWLDCLKW